MTTNQLTIKFDLDKTGKAQTVNLLRLEGGFAILSDVGPDLLPHLEEAVKAEVAQPGYWQWVYSRLSDGRGWLQMPR